MIKRFFASFSILLLLIIISCVCFKNLTFENSTATSAKVLSDIVIIIDAGHGGFDGGAVAKDGTLEKDLNLQIAKKLNFILNGIGYKTVMVREEDVSTNDPTDGEKAKVSDIKNRLKFMEKYPNAVFVSIHMNKFSTTQPHGAQVFYSEVDGSYELADAIQSQVSENLQTDNKRVVKKTTNNIYLLKHATVPSVIVECGFMSNPSDLKSLKDSEYQLKLATSLSYGIINYVG